MPTVEQVWHDVTPAGTELIDGDTGIYNQVSWVATMRSTPPGFDHLRGNEIVLIDVDVARDLGVSLQSVVASLIEKKVSAIGILGLISGEVVVYAGKYHMPLLKVPEGCALPSLGEKISRLISEERDILYQREQELTSELMDLALAGRGVDSILDRLRAFSGRKILLLNTAFHPHLDPEVGLEDIQKLLHKTFNLPPLAINGFKLSGELSGFINPISGKQGAAGFLLLLAPAGHLREDDRMVTKVGALALAVEMSRLQAVEDVEDKFQEEILESLLSGELPVEAANERASKLGLDPAKSYVTISVSLPEKPKRDTIIRRISHMFGEDAACFSYGDTILMFYAVEPETTFEKLRRLNSEVALKFTQNLGDKMTQGMGRLYPTISGLRLSFNEAVQALTTGQRLFGEGAVSFFGDLGIYKLLLSIKNEELQSFYREMLGKLADYEGQHRGEMMHTLEIILKHPTIAEAAQELHVHRNTLLYRISRIQEITNLNLNDGETRLMLYMALKVAEVIHSS